MLAHAFVSKWLSFAVVPSSVVVLGPASVFALDQNAALAVLQSRVHEVWALVFASSLKDDLQYTRSDCFETFPFPPGWQSSEALEFVGGEYYEFRAKLMVRNEEGLTKTHNRFHDPDERSLDIVKLRELHAGMDRAVLDAYGWVDIKTDCEFLLDYEIDEEEWGDKKKPLRYRWPVEVREEVLARLLELNAERAKAEARAGSGGGGPTRGSLTKPSKGRGSSAKKGSKRKPIYSKTGDLF